MKSRVINAVVAIGAGTLFAACGGSGNTNYQARPSSATHAGKQATVSEGSDPVVGTRQHQSPTPAPAKKEPVVRR